MASYADMAKRGPEQTPEEKMANPVPEVIAEDVPETTSTIDVDSGSVTVVPHDFLTQEIQTNTQSEAREIAARQDRMAEEAKKEQEEAIKAAAERARVEAEEMKAHAKAAAENVEEKAQEVKHKIGEVVEEGEEKAAIGAQKIEKAAHNLTHAAHDLASDARTTASRSAASAKRVIHRDIGETNAMVGLVVDAIGLAFLGVTGYKKYARGELTWKTFGLGVAGAVGFFAVQGVVQTVFSKKFQREHVPEEKKEL
ncbi:hypothetical protein G7K_6825-t1 [Saitoella complicata NRRL Y-17804]|uniref:Uncharacterized protein n=1 Tax=Saitoella complicata (strain BCRC 22490 / CBS 7301 / JCM 7358 / NBRC 10748 / NRRL Y-17804) TaxID=698492 RepID=A0A0E9NSV0_SAICN|nr:hypothetical protein G7K_6825-t1 [Saitoella complicata NRRL Y-17804]